MPLARHFAHWHKLTLSADATDVAETNTDGQIRFRTLDKGAGSDFDPDPATQAITGEYGVCVDLDYSMQQGCKDPTLSQVMDAAIGCFDRQVSMFLCGLELNVSCILHLHTHTR